MTPGARSERRWRPRGKEGAVNLTFISGADQHRNSIIDFETETAIRCAPPQIRILENAMNRFLITLTLTGTLFLMGCQSPEPAPKAEEKAAAPAAATPPPRKMTALPVVGYAGDQADLLKSSNPKLAANKKLAYDFFRIILRGRRLDRAAEFMTEDYIQHNPNADTGMAGFKAYFSALGGEQPIPEKSRRGTDPRI